MCIISWLRQLAEYMENCSNGFGVGISMSELKTACLKPDTLGNVAQLKQ